MTTLTKLAGLALAAASLAACGGGGGGGSSPTVRTAYTMTNAAAGNGVAAFNLVNGALLPLATYASGGNGTGTAATPAAPNGGNDPLGSQAALVLTPNKRFLLAVNAGSDSVSSFRVKADGSLTLVDTQPTGDLPISVAATNGRVVVANLANPVGGTPGSLSAFTLSNSGKLTAVAGGTRALAAANSRVTCVVFSADGNDLIATERTSNLVTDYPVGSTGALGAPTTVASVGGAPFGASVKGDLVFVANAGNASASTYRIANHALTAVSDSVVNGNRASCWAAFSPDGRHGYTANPGTNNLTAYAVATDGTLTVQQAAVSAGTAADGPLDAAVSSDGLYYVQLLGLDGKLALYTIDANGNLTAAGASAAVLPLAGAQGLVIR